MQAMLRELKSELESALVDVEAQLEQLGGSATTASVRSYATAKSGVTGKSFASTAQPSIAE